MFAIEMASKNSVAELKNVIMYLIFSIIDCSDE